MFSIKIPREVLEHVISVVLRVPSLFIIEVWFRTDPIKVMDARSRDLEIIVTVASYLALVLAVTIATLPLQKLVTLYMYLVSISLLILAHLLSYMYVFEEGDVTDSVGAILPKSTRVSLFTDRPGFESVIMHLAAQCFIAAFITYLIELRSWLKFAMLAYCMPMIARLCGLSALDLPAVHTMSTSFVLILVTFYVFDKLGYALDYAKDNVNQVILAIRAFGWIPVVITFWHTILFPWQLLIFWIMLFCRQVYIFSYESHPIINEGWVIILLASLGECCSTPVSLFAFCISVSYISYAALTATRFYLQGRYAGIHENDPLHGWTEGFTMLLIAVQTGLLELRPSQRAFLMSILLFIVISSLIQSIYEITDPVLLVLGASHNKNAWKHTRAILLATFLWIFPLYMTYTICQYFTLDSWLLIIISSSLLTSLQVIGSLVVYALFMYDSLRAEPWEKLDDVIYYAKASTRILEFIVAVFVVYYGVKESVTGHWSWVNSAILILHCYFNVWQRLQSGWKTYLLRREAVKVIETLPEASEEQLEEHSDICSICFQQMKSARITPCGHYFHALCLRKWLFVKDACPMCHQNFSQQEQSTDNNQQGQEHNGAEQHNLDGDVLDDMTNVTSNNNGDDSSVDDRMGDNEDSDETYTADENSSYRDFQEQLD